MYLLSLMQSIPSAFAKQWLPRKLVRVTLWDSGGQKSTARWAGNRKKSACLKSFREFSLSHCLEEGDACVFELMDPNPNNPVFLVHVFRVVELPNTRIAPKEWEDHYKLDVMIGTVRAVPLAEGNSDIQPLQSSQPLSKTQEGNYQNPSGPSHAPKIPNTLAQLSPKSKTKAIYSAILRRKTRINEENGHPELLRIDQGEGSLREQENSSHLTQSHVQTHGTLLEFFDISTTMSSSWFHVSGRLFRLSPNLVVCRMPWRLCLLMRELGFNLPGTVVIWSVAMIMSVFLCNNIM